MSRSRFARASFALSALLASEAVAGNWPRLPTDAEIETAKTERLESVEGAEGAKVEKLHRPGLLPNRVAAAEVVLPFVVKKAASPISVNGQVVGATPEVTYYYSDWLRWDAAEEEFAFGHKAAAMPTSALEMAAAAANRPLKSEADHERRVAAWFQGDNPLVYGFPPKDDGKSLCDEALEHFSADRLAQGGFGNAENAEATAVRMDMDDLQKDFQSAIERYQQAAGTSATKSDNFAGVGPAGSWLFAEGGVYEPVSRRFVFNDGYDDSLGPRMPGYRAPTPGTEPALRDAMLALHREQGRKLTPGDVFFLALQQRKGDARDALLLAHNTLRSLARNGDKGLTGLSPTPSFFSEHLATIRSGDNAGPWYHLFGTAYFEMEARGEWGPFLVLNMGDRLGTGAWDYAIGPLVEKITGVKAVTSAEDPAVATISDIANWMEQRYRERKNLPDPEKYCFNVWGAKLGAWLFSRLPYPPSSPAVSTAPAAPPLGLIPDAGGGFRTRGGHNVVLSPVRVTWEGNGKRMTFDGRSGDVVGGFPVLLHPIHEADGTWGVAWTDLTEEPYSLRFEGLRAGTLHFARVDRPSGRTAVFVRPIGDGEQWTAQIEQGKTPETLVASDGSVATAVVAQGPKLVDETALSGADIPGIETIDSGETSGLRLGVVEVVFGAIMGVVLLLGAGVILLLVFRRRR